MSEIISKPLSWKHDFAFSKPSTFPLVHRIAMLVSVSVLAFFIFKFTPGGELLGIFTFSGALFAAFVILSLMLERILLGKAERSSSEIIQNSPLEKARRYLNRGLHKLSTEQIQNYGGSWGEFSRYIRAWAFLFYTLIVLSGGGSIGLFAYGYFR